MLAAPGACIQAIYPSAYSNTYDAALGPARHVLMAVQAADAYRKKRRMQRHAGSSCIFACAGSGIRAMAVLLERAARLS